MYKAKNANAAYTDTEMVFVKGFDPDNKWVLKDAECGKAYKICVDIRAGKERMMMSEFVPYEMIYMVGVLRLRDGALEMPRRCRPRIIRMYLPGKVY